MPENETPQPVGNTEPRSLVVLPRLYKIMLGLFVIAPFSFFLGPGALLPLGLLAFFLLVTLITGIVTTVKVRCSHGLLIDHGYATASVAMPLFIIAASGLMILAVSVAMNNIVGIHGWEISELERDLDYYTDSNDGLFPPASGWSDALLGDSKSRHWGGRMIDNGPPACNFALNAEALPLGRGMPKDMVLAFSSSKGWNQVGGQELAKPIRTSLVAVLFGDGHVELVRSADVKHLRWRVADSGTIPERPVAMWLAAVSAMWAIILGASILFVRRHLARRSGFASGLATCAGVVGALLGLAGAGFLYGGSQLAFVAGLMSGSISGILVAVVFAGLLGWWLDKGHTRESLQPFAHIAGMAAGAVCAAATHSAMMAASGETSFLPLLGGVGFGMYAGVIVGDVAARIFARPSSRLLAGEQNAVS